MLPEQQFIVASNGCKTTILIIQGFQATIFIKKVKEQNFISLYYFFVEMNLTKFAVKLPLLSKPNFFS